MYRRLFRVSISCKWYKGHASRPSCLLLCRLHKLHLNPFQTAFCLVSRIVFSIRLHDFLLETILRFAWNDTIVSLKITGSPLRMFLNLKKWYHFMLNVEFCFRGAWTVTCTFKYRPCTGSIKPQTFEMPF
jgi:hypothetical protein